MERVIAGFEMRDYSLHGEESRRALASGLATATWYRPDVPRARMKALMQRRDAPAIRDTAIWLGLTVVLAVASAVLWPSPWALLPLFFYGVLYGSASDSRWHECGHGTAFRTDWMNRAVYQIACFMIMRDPTVWRWSHTRHHTDTIIVGRDAEILFTRPPKPLALAANLFGLLDVPKAMKAMVVHASGRLEPDEKLFVPDTEWHKTYRVARVWIVLYAAAVALCLATRSVLPLVLVGLPRLYGCWHMVVCGMMQHGGLAEDVLDHRLNSRTVYLNPFSRFVYWNMNYHVEHHLFPMVPFHALASLHAELADQLAVPSPSFAAGLGEVLGALRRQVSDPTYVVPRRLPDGTTLVPDPAPSVARSSR